jgi:hypothetical protein
MSKVIFITFSVTPSATLELPWPTFGQGDEFPSTVKYGRVRTGALRSYITNDPRLIITSWSFNLVPLTDYNIFLTDLALYCNNSIIVDFQDAEQNILYTYTGKFKTPVIEHTHELCDYISFQTQFVGVKS